VGVARAGSSPALGTNHPRCRLLRAPVPLVLASAARAVRRLDGPKSQTPSIKLQTSTKPQ
jgi:hypothetical protein